MSAGLCQAQPGTNKQTNQNTTKIPSEHPHQVEPKHSSVSTLLHSRYFSALLLGSKALLATKAGSGAFLPSEGQNETFNMFVLKHSLQQGCELKAHPCAGEGTEGPAGQKAVKPPCNTPKSLLAGWERAGQGRAGQHQALSL